MCSTDPTRQTCATVDQADCSAPTRKRELDPNIYTDHTDHERIFPEIPSKS